MINKSIQHDAAADLAIVTMIARRGAPAIIAPMPRQRLGRQTAELCRYMVIKKQSIYYCHVVFNIHKVADIIV